MSETARGAMPPKGDSLLFPTRARRPAPPAAGRRGRGSEAEKEGFEPSRQGFSPPNALAGRRLQPLGHFSGRAEDSEYRRRSSWIGLGDGDLDVHPGLLVAGDGAVELVSPLFQVDLEDRRPA